MLAVLVPAIAASSVAMDLLGPVADVWWRSACRHGCSSFVCGFSAGRPGGTSADGAREVAERSRWAYSQTTPSPSRSYIYL